MPLLDDPRSVTGGWEVTHTLPQSKPFPLGSHSSFRPLCTLYSSITLIRAPAISRNPDNQPLTALSTNAGHYS